MPRWFTCPQTVTYPSSNEAQVSINKVELTEPIMVDVLSPLEVGNSGWCMYCNVE